MRRPTLLLCTLAVATAGLAACGDTTEDEPESADAAGEPTDCDADPGDTVTVEIPEFTFDPDPVEVGVCDSVMWSNEHDQAHTSTGEGDRAWNTGNIAPGEESEPVRFDAIGEQTYICALHPFMQGTVVVS